MHSVTPDPDLRGRYQVAKDGNPVLLGATLDEVLDYLVDEERDEDGHLPAEYDDVVELVLREHGLTWAREDRAAFIQRQRDYLRRLAGRYVAKEEAG